jgi:hypothetical protein
MDRTPDGDVIRYLFIVLLIVVIAEFLVTKSPEELRRVRRAGDLRARALRAS